MKPFAICALFFTFVFLTDANADGKIAGRIVAKKGTVSVITNGMETVAKTGMQIYEGSTLLTGADGWIAVALADESLMQVSANSRLFLKSVPSSAGWIRAGATSSKPFHARSEYQLGKGEIWFRNKEKRADIRVITPTVVGAIRGTELDLKIGKSGAVTVTTLEGGVALMFGKNSVMVGAGEQVSVMPDFSYSKRVLLSPAYSVQWIIPLPSLLGSFDFSAHPSLAQAAEAAKKGALGSAEKQLQQIISSGSFDPSAYSLLSLIQLALGNSKGAIISARSGTSLQAGSSFAWLVRSYAEQAGFDITSSTDSAQIALSISPGSVPALVQHATLLFGSGKIDSAGMVIDRVDNGDPNNSSAVLISGFISLADYDTGSALEKFRRVIKKDPPNAEAYMGMAISLFRKGEKNKAFEAISIAALLDPRRSIFVTYHGKMLYQLKRFKQALDLFEYASMIDPNDPTPWLYKAYALRDLNRPTSAIKALQKAIALNGKRAVYRSKFMLDTDSAVKNVDLSLVYNQLGLSAWAVNKAYRAIKLDFRNASGHRFLAGALSNMERRLRATGSELLLGNILAPANQNSFNSFNEYTSFFEMPELRWQTTLQAGSQNYKQATAFVYGALPESNLAFSFLGKAAKDSGWNGTDGITSSGLNLDLKWDMTRTDRFTFHTAQTGENKGGGVDGRFLYDNPPLESDSVISGGDTTYGAYHKNFENGSDLILYFSLTDLNAQIGSLTSLPFNDAANIVSEKKIDFRQSYLSGQGEYLFKWGNHQSLIGGLYYENRERFLSENSITLVAGDTELPVSSISTGGSERPSLQSYYASDIWHMSETLTIESAIYYDHMLQADPFSSLTWERSELNPRIGLILEPTDSLTFRGAWFRYLVPGIADRLDGTDIAGLPVYRNTFVGSLSNETSASIEYEYENGFISAGYYDLDSGFELKTKTDGIVNSLTQRGKLRGYSLVLNALLWEGAGLAMEYNYNDISYKISGDTNRVEHLFTAGLTQVFDNGITLSATGTRREFSARDSALKGERIYIADLFAKYELPEKSGFLKLSVLNLFDSHFNWITDPFVLRGRVPARQITASLIFFF